MPLKCYFCLFQRFNCHFLNTLGVYVSFFVISSHAERRGLFKNETRLGEESYWMGKTLTVNSLITYTVELQ
jgi:hypothetical protein